MRFIPYLVGLAIGFLLIIGWESQPNCPEPIKEYRTYVVFFEDGTNDTLKTTDEFYISNGDLLIWKFMNHPKVASNVKYIKEL